MVLEAIALPLRDDATGVLRVGGTRVTFESVMWAWRDGATAEGIVEAFPALRLADVYAVVAYALTHEAEVDDYLARASAQERVAIDRLAHDFPQVGLRERLLARARTGDPG